MTQAILQRKGHARLQVTIVANTCDSTPFDMRQFQTLMVCTPPAMTAAALGVKVGPVENSAFHVLYQQRPNSLVSVPVLCYSVTVNQAHVFPELGAARYAKLWSNDGAGADVDQTADCVFDVFLKG